MERYIHNSLRIPKHRSVFLICLTTVVVIFFLTGSIFLNKFFLENTTNDLSFLKKFYGENYQVKSFQDLVVVQHLTIDKIPHSEFNKFFSSKLSLDRIDKLETGNCFDRSFLLQKLLISNNFKVVPIYIFYDENYTYPISFFKKRLFSHSIFKVKINNEWVYVETNDKMKIYPINSFQEYLSANYNNNVPFHAMHIEHLFSRNGRFIGPPIFPDVY